MFKGDTMWILNLEGSLLEAMPMVEPPASRQVGGERGWRQVVLLLPQKSHHGGRCWIVYRVAVDGKTPYVTT